MPTDPMPPPDVLARLKREWLWALDEEWVDACRMHLDRKPRKPAFALHEGTSRLGLWSGGRRLISISEEHIWSSPWAEVVETLRHEIAHQYVDEVAEAADEKPHGPAFRDACRMLGISSDATGHVRKPPGGASDAILRRIRRLLALAGSTNEHEARIAAAKAHQLMLKYNIDRVEGGGREAYTYRRLGKGYASIPHERHLIAGILRGYYFVQTIWVREYDVRRCRWENRLEVLGTEENVALAEHVHDFLSAQSERLWREELARHRDDSFAYMINGPFTRKERKEFFAGLIGALDSTLGEQSQTLGEERGLIWVGDPRLKEYYHRRYPYRDTCTTSEAGVSRAWLQGNEAGRGLKIHKPISEGKAEDKGKLLT